MLSKRYSGGYSVGDHLFPFRTEKLSPTAPMVLHTRGRVGRRQLFYKPLSTDLLREAFFLCALVFFGGRVLTWGRRVLASALPSWGSKPQLGNKKMYCICLSRHRALPSKCRRGDASPPGEDAIPPGEDAISLGEDVISLGEDVIPQVRTRCSNLAIREGLASVHVTYVASE